MPSGWVGELSLTTREFTQCLGIATLLTSYSRSCLGALDILCEKGPTEVSFPIGAEPGALNVQPQV